MDYRSPLSLLQTTQAQSLLTGVMLQTPEKENVINSLLVLLGCPIRCKELQKNLVSVKMETGQKMKSLQHISSCWSRVLTCPSPLLLTGDPRAGLLRADINGK